MVVVVARMPKILISIQTVQSRDSLGILCFVLTTHNLQFEEGNLIDDELRFLCPYSYADTFCDFWVVFQLCLTISSAFPFNLPPLLNTSEASHFATANYIMHNKVNKREKKRFRQNYHSVCFTSYGRDAASLKWDHLARKCAHHTMVKNIARSPKLK